MTSKCAFIFFLFVLKLASVNAQVIAVISGQVVNANREPLIGTALLSTANDTSLIKANNLINGKFEFTDVNEAEVILRLRSLEFRDTLIPIKYDGEKQIDLGTILMKTAVRDLQEVQITGYIAPIRQHANGNIEVSVANTMLARSSSVNEVLSRAPNVVVNDDGQIQVIGRGEASIYLNGKLINRERIATIPTSQIVKIEIVANPSAKYDAEGRAVINIITKVMADEEFTGKVTQQMTVSDFAGRSSMTLLDLAYTRSKFTLVGNYGLQLGSERELLYTIRNRPLANEYLNSELTTDWQRRFKPYTNYGLGFQYDFSNKTTVSLNYSGNRNSLGGTVNSANTLTTDTDKIYFTSDNAKDELRYNHSITLNMNKSIDSLGSSLFVGSQYAYYNATVRDFIAEESQVNDDLTGRFLKSNMDQNIVISSTQTDYTKAFNAISRLETGAKFSYVTTRSANQFFINNKDDSDFSLDTGLSNRFNYVERLMAAYVSYSRVVGEKITVNIGFRGEWTDYQLNTSVGTGQPIKKKFFNLFPNLQINMPFSEQLKLRGAYTARITRPRYESLNPLVIYQDPLTTIEGNPYLLPEKIHAFEVGATYDGFDLKLGYNYTIDPLSGGAIRGKAPNSYILKGFNIYRTHRYLMGLSKTFSLNGWSSTNMGTLSYTKEVDKEYQFAFFKPRAQLYLYSNNTFKLKSLFDIQLLAWYLGEEYSGLFYRKSRATITAGIERSFFNDKLKVNITANDIFHNFIAEGDYTVGQTDIYFHRTYTTNYFRWMIIYNFGSSKKSVYRSRDTGRSESNRAG